MSAVSNATAVRRAVVAPDLRPEPARHLAPVTTRPKRRPRVAYGLTALIGAVIIGAIQMGLSIATTQATFEASQLSAQQRELSTQSQVLRDEVAGLSSPQYLASNAASLGLVIGAAPTYLRLSDGAIIGTGAAAPAVSTVDALGRAAVPNDLVSNTSLATAPGVTMNGSAVVDTSIVATPSDTDETDPTAGTVAEEVAPVEAVGPPVADTIPTPSTR